MAVRNLIPILGDQLSQNLSALEAADPKRDILIMMEVRAETQHVWHHRKKLAFLFSAMRHHAEWLRSSGWRLEYICLDDPDNTGNFSEEMKRAVQRLQPQQLLMTRPGEFRVMSAFQKIASETSLPLTMLEDQRFISCPDEFNSWADGRKQLRMEYFYREMRRKTGLLMDGDKPIGGKWNFDQENRETAPDNLFLPGCYETKSDSITKKVLNLVEREFPDQFGDLKPFWFAVDRRGAKRVLDHFLTESLPNFGRYQDAMVRGRPFLYHSLISLYLNVGLLDPMEVCLQVEDAYKTGYCPLNSAEGFIRQIIGWREFIRGIYWREMPRYEKQNFLNAKRSLPDFYWTGCTKMACMADCLEQTIEQAYAHHIQRLMVTGNFALLAGINPHALHEWYLAVYADAFEWVELPNTLGMSQHADGGLLGSKPYAASGNYINRMSDYCQDCSYDVADKTGPNSCPFNSLYWHFLDRHRDQFAENSRMAAMYRNWARMSQDQRSDYLSRAEECLELLGVGKL